MVETRLFFMKIAVACFFFFICSRDWELWDQGCVAQVIDAYWLGSKEEIEHRKKLALFLKEWALPNDKILEVGCGSGLIYSELAASFKGYVGVDISEKMLEIATRRFPEALFMKGDLYNLSFLDSSFEITVAFEVFGHINGIEKPIREMFRTSSRLAIFTVWTAPKTKFEREIIEDAVFIRNTFSHDDVMKAIESALKDQRYTVATRPISYDKTAYTIRKL
jgi:ubiquinone/menaquinone biosynthesis C-methylase UbiE